MAPAIATIQEIGHSKALDEAVADAFPGSGIRIITESGRFSLGMQQHGMLRSLDAVELSDGTLRYLLWIAALLTPRPPALMVLNEPETSLHPELLPALARLIGRVSDTTQVVVVTHAERLIAPLAEMAGCNSIKLEKKFGETSVVGLSALQRPEWHWSGR